LENEATAAMTTIEDLWAEIDSRCPAHEGIKVALESAVGKTASEPVLAPQDYPSFDHSAMDGYAFAEIAPGECRVAAEIAAGATSPLSVSAGECVRILTGALLPEGTLCVARQEECIRDGPTVRLMSGIKLRKGDNMRLKGGIFPARAAILGRGACINSGVVALLASLGLARVCVHRPPVITHIATGNELLAPGEQAVPGKIFDSNGAMIAALVTERGLELHRHRIRDIRPALERLTADFAGDLLLISGGSGTGDHDHSRGSLERAGFDIHTRRINSRPGKPLIFGTRGAQVAFGLPGNPLSHWVCFHAFVSRVITRMLGRPVPVLQHSHCPDWDAQPGDGRRTWTPACWRVKEGRILAEPLKWEHSGDLSPLARANALLLDEPDPETRLIKTFLL